MQGIILKEYKFQIYLVRGYVKMEKKANHYIACSVEQCANHSGEGYCALDKIQVGTHEQNPTVIQCTDCESFVLGCDSCKG